MSRSPIEMKPERGALTLPPMAAVQRSRRWWDRLDRLEAITTQGVRASGSIALRASLNR